MPSRPFDDLRALLDDKRETLLRRSSRRSDTEAAVDVRAAQRAVKERYARDPSASRVTLRATAAAVGPSPFTCNVRMRQTKLESAAHEAIGITHAAPCSGELLLGALAACAQTSVQVIANAMKIPIAHVEVYAEGDIDFRGTLGVSREVPIGFTALRLRFELDAPDATPEQVRSLREKVERYCIIQHTLQVPPAVSSEWTQGQGVPTLHQFVFSCSCEKVRRALHHKGITWRTVETDWFDRSSLEALSGQRLAPVLVHGETILGPDSIAILDYLEKEFDGPSLFPNDTRAFSQVMNDYVEGVLFPLAMRAFFPAAARSIENPSFEADVRRIAGASSDELWAKLPETLAAYEPHLKYLDGWLAASDYFAGDLLSAADHIVYSNLWFATNNPEFRKMVDSLGLSHLSAWEHKMKSDYFTAIPF